MMRSRESKKDIEFEIQFYEALLTKNPNFVEALAALGDAYTKRGLYQKGLVVDERLAKIKPDDPVVLYNLACSYSLLNDLDKAFVFVKKAVTFGYCDFHHMQRDEDLNNLRSDSRFKRYMINLKKKLNKG